MRENMVEAGEKNERKHGEKQGRRMRESMGRGREKNEKKHGERQGEE